MSLTNVAALVHQNRYDYLPLATLECTVLFESLRKKYFSAMHSVCLRMGEEFADFLGCQHYDLSHSPRMLDVNEQIFANQLLPELQIGSSRPTMSYDSLELRRKNGPKRWGD